MCDSKYSGKIYYDCCFSPQMLMGLVAYHFILTSCILLTNI